jgi:1-acyl-sn-glycerol-3-phosphate acyltransferase
MANHGCVFDPFFVNNFIRHPIHYVVADANFRSRILDFGLSLVGSIPKTKVMSDLETVKNIVRVKDRNGIVGIFPEGQSSWDGTTLPIYYSTAKLLKVMRVPVVFARLRGAFLSRPRWSRNPRNGRVEIDYTIGFDGPDLKKLSVEAIHDRIVELLDHKESEYNRRARIRFRGLKRAEYIEIVLFLCPECRAQGSIHSRGNHVTCTSCGYKVYYDEFGFFRQRSQTFHFATLDEWNNWQIETFHEIIELRFRSNDTEPILIEKDVEVETGYKSMPMEHFARGSISLYLDRFEVQPENGDDRLELPVAEVTGINVQNRERLEFYVDNTLYKITPVDPRTCTYKWNMAVRRIQELADAFGRSMEGTANQ